MVARQKPPEETYGPALQKARQELAVADLQITAVRAGVSCDATLPERPHLLVPFLHDLYRVHLQGGVVERADASAPVDATTQIIVLHYLLTADGTRMADRWIAFRNLPGGLGYDAAFQGRANLRLARAFASDRSGFEEAARALGGERLSFGDASFSFRALPHLWLAAVLNLADEEFPADASVLFDASASHYLPTEDLAVLGGLLASRLIRASRAR
jgi:hypothetical protein